MWELDHKEGWMLKNWCFWIVVLEKTLESPLDCKEIILVNLKGNQPWVLIGRTGAEVEALILGHLIWKADSLEKTLKLGKIEGKRRRWQQKMRWLDNISDSMDMNLGELWEMVKDRWAWHNVSMESQRIRHDLVTEQQQWQRPLLTQLFLFLFVYQILLFSQLFMLIFL